MQALLSKQAECKMQAVGSPHPGRDGHHDEKQDGSPYSMMRSWGRNGDRESRPSRLTTCKEQHLCVSPIVISPIASSFPAVN